MGGWIDRGVVDDLLDCRPPGPSSDREERGFIYDWGPIAQMHVLEEAGAKQSLCHVDRCWRVPRVAPLVEYWLMIRAQIEFILFEGA